MEVVKVGTCMTAVSDERSCDQVGDAHVVDDGQPVGIVQCSLTLDERADLRINLHEACLA